MHYRKLIHLPVGLVGSESVGPTYTSMLAHVHEGVETDLCTKELQAYCSTEYHLCRERDTAQLHARAISTLDRYH